MLEKWGLLSCFQIDPGRLFSTRLLLLCPLSKSKSLCLAVGLPSKWCRGLDGGESNRPESAWSLVNVCIPCESSFKIGTTSRLYSDWNFHRSDILRIASVDTWNLKAMPSICFMTCQRFSTLWRLNRSVKAKTHASVTRSLCWLSATFAHERSCAGTVIKLRITESGAGELASRDRRWRRCRSNASAASRNFEKSLFAFSFWLRHGSFWSDERSL